MKILEITSEVKGTSTATLQTESMPNTLFYWGRDDLKFKKGSQSQKDIKGAN